MGKGERNSKLVTVLLLLGVLLTGYSVRTIENGTKTVIAVDAPTGGYSITQYHITLNTFLIENIGIIFIASSLTRIYKNWKANKENEIFI
ncbi:MAG TPA: hypothetical protein VMW22_08355 [Candidatus Desulfaltia sp.]|nr:hypothetical protein [Candidatus Desulfaltia sp.]